MRQKLELLAPAGNLTALKAVIHAGADAVYFGGSAFGARAYADNFKKEEVLFAIDFAHIHGRKTFMAVNTLLKEQEMEEQLYDYLLPYYEQGLDAVIVQDFGVFSFVKQHFPKLPIHASTQMTVAGAEGAGFLAKLGASRIVMAREMSLSEIDSVYQALDVEIESFVHGALCYCYSGQCLFSSMIGGRSGNRGRCAQPCRLPYECYDVNYHKISGKEKFPLSPKDLCTIDLIPKLAGHGVFSFKIEGRMKQPEYAAGVTAIYRKYIDMYLNHGEEGYHVLPEDNRKLFDLGNRSGFTQGYYNKQNGKEMLAVKQPSHTKSNDELQRQIKEAYIDKEIKEKIQGIFFMKEGEPAALTVDFGEHRVTKQGAVPVTAKNQPLTKEFVLEKLQKTGGTPFEFGRLTTDMEDGLYQTVSALNELRRETLEELEKKLTEPYRRKKYREYTSFSHNYGNLKEYDIELRVFAEKTEQFEAAVNYPPVSRIYMDSMAFDRDSLVKELKEKQNTAHKLGKELYYVLPAVFRRHTAEFYKKVLPALEADGFLVKSYDALGFLLNEGIAAEKLRLDANMYTFSNRTKYSFLELGIGGDTVPLELNRKELNARDNRGSEMIVYGYVPIMTSAQCIPKNFAGCQKTRGMYYLKDRYGVYFPVKNHCGECYNVIYNSRPLQFYSLAEELKDEGITKWRLNFTIENRKETEQILEDWCNGISHGFLKERFHHGEITYGHYKRGVE